MQKDLTKLTLEYRAPAAIFCLRGVRLGAVRWNCLLKTWLSC